MRIRTMILVAAVAVSVGTLALPGTSWAGRTLVGVGHLQSVDQVRSTITVRNRVIKVSFRSSLQDGGERRIDLEELASMEGQEVQYTAYPVGRTLYLTTLQVGVAGE